MELEDVWGGVDHRPFSLHIREVARQKLPEAARALDLAEYRLDDLLAKTIAAPPSGAPDLDGHRRHAWRHGSAIGFRV